MEDQWFSLHTKRLKTYVEDALAFGGVAFTTHEAIDEWKAKLIAAETRRRLRKQIANVNSMKPNPCPQRFVGASERITIEHRAWMASLLRFRYADSVSSKGDRRYGAF